MLSRLKTFLLKPFFMAMFLSLFVIFFLPNLFDKYKISIVDSGPLVHTSNSRVYNYDLDHDGFSEQIYSFDYQGKHAIQVLTHDKGTVDQWNMKGTIVSDEGRLTIGNFDKDGFDEIYTFYQKSDSILLYCFEPLDTISPICFSNKYICTLTREYSEPDPQILNVKSIDIDGDNYEEIVFVIIAGQARFPRNIYIYDLFNDTLKKSPEYGSTFALDISLIDFDQDGKKEIIGGSIAAGQINDSLGFKYGDYNAWLMAYNQNLNLLFEPIKFPGFQSWIHAKPIIIDDKPLLIYLYNHLGQSDNYPELGLVDINGKVLKKLNFPKSSKIRRSLFVSTLNGNNQLNLIDEEGHISIFNDEFQLINEHELDAQIHLSSTQMDLNKDGEYESVFNTKNNGLLITNQGFTSSLLLNYQQPLEISKSSLILNGTKKPSLFIYSENEFITIQYGKNPLAPLRFFIYLAIFLSIWAFIQLIRKLQLIQIQKQENIHKQIVNLQLKSFRNQLDPHFTFNVFTAMAQNIMKESPGSYEAFMKFSNLIRNALESSDKVTRTIEEELSSLKDYIYLEKLRFPDKFKYKIEVDKQVNRRMKIPKMILQIYVENAIKHGIMPLDGVGLINIIIGKNDQDLHIEIIDNGIGREKAKQLSTESNGFGLRIMENYFRLFNEYNESKINQEIIDLYNKQNISTGTKVKIIIPLNFSYNLEKNF